MQSPTIPETRRYVLTQNAQHATLSLMNMNVRRATHDDWPEIEALYQTSGRFMPRLGNWRDLLDQDLFLVLEDARGVRGALLAWADDSPVAWIRLGVLHNTLSTTAWFDLVWPVLRARLEQREIEHLLWMDCQGWAAHLLSQRGFRQFTRVITLVKYESSMPSPAHSSAALRPAAAHDTSAIMRVDRKAFTPHWWYSENTIRQRIADATQFTVALRDTTIVGYAESAVCCSNGHINRIVVEPSCQGQGIGALLLHNMLSVLWQHDVASVTINTQVDNISARRLYQRFGFTPTDDPVTVWNHEL